MYSDARILTLANVAEWSSPEAGAGLHTPPETHATPLTNVASVALAHVSPDLISLTRARLPCEAARPDPLIVRSKSESCVTSAGSKPLKNTPEEPEKKASPEATSWGDGTLLAFTQNDLVKFKSIHEIL